MKSSSGIAVLPHETMCSGILNVTPDSFSDGGLYFTPEKALLKAQELITDGANLVEVGADSTRPGSECVGVHEEIKRLQYVLSGLRERGVEFGVDTHQAAVAEFAIEQGARYINDISGGMDEELVRIVACSPSVDLILMHSRLTQPHVFGDSPVGDVVHVVVTSLEKILQRALTLGMKEERVILDTGMGGFVSAFPFHSQELLARFEEIVKNFSQKFMLGISRKGFLGKDLSLEQKDALSCSLSLEPLKTGRVKYLRVHDCKRYKRN